VKISCFEVPIFSFDGLRLLLKLDILHGNLGINKLQFFVKKIRILSVINFEKKNYHHSSGSGSALKPLRIHWMEGFHCRVAP
jgi:hypothetical protein